MAVEVWLEQRFGIHLGAALSALGRRKAFLIIDDGHGIAGRWRMHSVLLRWKKEESKAYASH
jgi:hypothetical protein